MTLNNNNNKLCNSLKFLSLLNLEAYYYYIFQEKEEKKTQQFDQENSNWRILSKIQSLLNDDDAMV